MLTNVCSRRAFLRTSAATAACTALATSAAEPASLIAGIEKVTLRRGRDGSGPTWFHPRACVVPGADGKTVFMTLQTIAGSDYFGPVHWMTSRDLGKTWTEPQPVPPLGRVKQAAGRTEEAVCDVVPEWHAKTKSVLAMGHNVFYSGPTFSREQARRCGLQRQLPSRERQPRRIMGHRRRDAAEAWLQGRPAPRAHPLVEAEPVGDDMARNFATIYWFRTFLRRAVLVSNRTCHPMKPGSQTRCPRSIPCSSWTTTWRRWRFSR